MIDYRAHAAFHQDLLQLFQNHQLPGDGRTLQDQLTQAALDLPDHALLGAFVDHLVWHANSDGVELGHVRTAAELWRRGRALYDRAGAARADIEFALTNPADPTAVTRFGQGFGDLKAMTTDLKAISTEITGLRTVLELLPHLATAHPRQRSAPIADWGLGDRFLARGTHLFFRELSGGTPEVTAFQAGVLSSYLGNVFGSGYLSSVTGGPRRAHRFRDRLARNSLGAWTAQQHPIPGLTAMADRLSFGAAAPADAALPADIRQAVETALERTYSGLPATADLDTGLRRMIEHLRLLDAFDLPPLPDPMSLTLLDTLEVSDLGAMAGGGVLGPANYGDDPQPGSNAGTSQPTTADKSSSSGNDCGWVIAFVIVALLVVAIDCIVQIVDHGECDPAEVLPSGQDDEEPDGQVVVEGQFLTTAATDGTGAHIVQHIIDVQTALWQSFASARTFLATIGLIYPPAEQLGSPLFAQFLSAPTDPGWPHREDPQALANYIFAPATPQEQATPTRSAAPSAARLFAAFPELAAELLARWDADPVNLDLDADRGHRHPCWTVADSGRITDQPVPVRVLGYKEI